LSWNQFVLVLICPGIEGVAEAGAWASVLTILSAEYKEMWKPSLKIIS